MSILSTVCSASYQLATTANGINLKNHIFYTYSSAKTPEALMAEGPVFNRLAQKNMFEGLKHAWYSVSFESQLADEKAWFINTLQPTVPILRVHMLDSKGAWQLIFDAESKFHEREVKDPLMVFSFKVSPLVKTRLLIEYQGL